MNPAPKLIILTFSLFFGILCCHAQEMASTYKPKNKTEKLVIAKIRALPEVKSFFEAAKKSSPDIMINPPDSAFNYCYAMQVGLANFEMFRTHAWLLIHPKTFKIYYLDIGSEGDNNIISLQAYRHWRNRPEFHKPHTWVNDKLVVIKEKPKKKHSKP